MFIYGVRLRELGMTLLINLIFSERVKTCLLFILDPCESIFSTCSISNAREHKTLFSLESCPVIEKGTFENQMNDSQNFIRDDRR
jgi:hypothetical protein